MLGQHSYHGITRKMVAVFGSLFNSIEIEKTQKDGTSVFIRIPVSYANRDKFLAKIKQNPNLKDQTAITLPRMSFEMVNISYDAERKLNKNHINVGRGTDGVLRQQFNPVPYNLSFDLVIYSKHQEDGLKIVEQIIPYFTPDLVLTANLVSDIGYKTDIPISLTSVTQEDSFEGEFTDRRTVTWTLSFDMKTYYFPSISTNVRPIRRVTVDFGSVTLDNPLILEGLSTSGTFTGLSTEDGRELLLDGQDTQLDTSITQEVDMTVDFGNSFGFDDIDTTNS